MKTYLFLSLIVTMAACDMADKSLSGPSLPEDYAETTLEAPITEEPESYGNATPEKQQHSNRKLIKKAQLQFETKDLKATTSQLRVLSGQFAGYISDENLEERSGSHWNRIQIKVPSESFDAILESISKSVEKFDHMNVTTQDVTEEYTDLQARIATKKKVEQRYLEILSNAKTIEEILKVEREVAAVREEIERAEGRVRYLSTRASMSSIQVAFYQVIPVADPIQKEQPTFVTNLVQALENGVDIIKGLMIGLANIWPLILIFGTVLFIYRKKWRKAETTA